MFASYCTGDVHLGDADTTYTVPDTTGSHTIRIHHRGQRNAFAALAWVYANFPAPSVVLVSGSSAGAVATPFYSSLMARHYPGARVAAVGDAASAYTKNAMDGADQGRWGIPDVLRRYRGWEHYEKGGVPGLYVNAARTAPGLELYQVDAAYDDAQRFFLELAGTKHPDVTALIRQDHAEISARVPAFRSFLIGGEIHTVMGEPMFYTYETDGHRFRDWVAAIVAGDSVPRVDCGACQRPDFVYSELDLRIIDRAIELLSKPGAWNPESDSTSGPPCPHDADRLTLACALIESGEKLGASAPGATPALLEVVYAAAARLSLPLRERPLTTFNDRPGTRLQDVLGLLREVRTRIAERSVRPAAAPPEGRTDVRRDTVNVSDRILHLQVTAGVGCGIGIGNEPAEVDALLPKQ